MIPGSRGRGVLLARTAALLALLTALVGCNLLQPPVQAPSTPTPVNLGTPAPVTVASPEASPSAGPASPVASPSAAASPAASPSPMAAREPRVVRGTGDEGLVLRREPAGERVGVIPEGRPVLDLGEERVVDGRSWRRVLAADGAEGWVAGQFLAAGPPDLSLLPGMASPTPSPPTITTVGGTPAPGGASGSGPEYGMNLFLAGNPATTPRDLAVLNRIGFIWQKSLFQWRSIEGAGKGIYDWRDADRVVAASRDARVKVIARLDFQPAWTRAVRANNGPPDNVQDFADFVRAFVERYRAGSARGTVHAIEIWNEPNLDREWGGAPINQTQAAGYVRLLRAAHEAAKRADPNVIVVTAGLSPTCTNDEHARPDDVYLQWLYDAGAAPYFDVLGAHGPGYDKPPTASPDESAAKHNGCRVFTFRRVEDLRAVMVRNGDAAKPVWLLELGWTTDTIHPAYAWFAVTPQRQAEYIVAAYQWARQHWSAWIGVMALWNLPDPNWTREREEYWWGIANPDGSARPALDMLQAARKDGRLP